MSFLPVASSVVKDKLTSITGQGLYSFLFFKDLSPIMADILYGKEALGVGVTKGKRNFSMKKINVNMTTSENGYEIKYRTIPLGNPSTVVTAVTSTTQIVIASTKGFSAGDHVIFTDPADECTVINAYVDTITGSTLNLLSAPATAVAVGMNANRISYSLPDCDLNDRTDYEIDQVEQSNYIQNFGANKKFKVDTLNSHIDLSPALMSMMPDPSASGQKMDRSEAAAAAYINLEFAKKIGVEIVGDVSRAFYFGTKNRINSFTGGKTRTYAGGLESVVNDIDTLFGAGTGICILDFTGTQINSDKQKMFDAIFEHLFNITYEAAHFGNERVSLIGNKNFALHFSQLLSEISYNFYAEEVSEYGYNLSRVKLPNGMGVVDLVVDSTLEQVNSNVPYAYVVPMDLIQAYRRMYKGLDDNRDLQKETSDIELRPASKNQDTYTCMEYNVFFNMTFVFAGSHRPIYKKIILRNMPSYTCISC